ncbi:hypothetical protein NQ314_000064 [Rhamnusium bicolor]|uniref:Uncharacterized protein n=1 Tax=Rhamnusium bicolor TaxID=1586634 RepID=A0AAV8ZX91_9CUCU|nr:hypothetical protein NQ314_000064 [Rhamnusium bicolor]
MQPHRRKRKRKDKEHNGEDDEEGISYEAPDRTVGVILPPPPAPKPKPKPVPPPINFAELLKIAEKKQFEPIVIEKKRKGRRKTIN